MKYAQLVNRSTQKGYNYSIGKRIKELMKDLRQRSNPHSERRWIWELLQNSKDARYPDKPLNICIKLDTATVPNSLEFQHTGQPFTVEHITFLTEQVSSKDRAINEEGEPSSTGKFGNGFLTTHLLSEIVKIDTIVKEPDLPYIKCTLVLDRSSTDVNDIIESVNKSLSVLSSMDDIPPYEHYSPADFNTTFHYPLNEKGIEVAEMGLQDLDISIPYTLIFVPNFNEIDIAHNGVTYQVRKELVARIGEIEIHTVSKTNYLFEEELTEIAIVRGTRVQLAVPVKMNVGKIVLQPLHPSTPRIFCDFPLVGTELFPFPIIINSPLFNPNDPRNRILLTDVNEKDILENKSLMEEAVALYRVLIDAAQDEQWQQTHLLAAFDDAKKLDWIDGDWYKEKVIGPIHDHLLTAVIVDTEQHGRKAMQNEEGEIQILFPAASDPDILDKIDALCRKWFPHALPRKNDIQAWNKVLWKNCASVNLRKLTEYIVQTKTLTALDIELDIDTDAIDWLNTYFDLVNIEGSVIKDIIANKFAVFPDQNGDFKLRDDVEFDNGLPGIIKDIFASLGKDIRSDLRDKRLYTANRHSESPKDSIRHTSRKLTAFYGELNELLKKADANLELNACARLACIFCDVSDFPPKRQKIFDALNRIFPDWNLELTIIPSFDEKIWEHADKVILVNLAACIAEQETVEKFCVNYGFPDVTGAVEWINDFVKLVIVAKEEALLNDAEYPFLPNQNGSFQIKDDLLQGLFVDDDLKDISAKLGHDFRDGLINDSISLPFSTNRTIDDSVVISQIKVLVAGFLSDMREDENTKEAFRLLFLWFSRYPKQGAEGFGDLYTTRHRLIKAEDYEDAAQKAQKLTEIMTNNDINDYDELDRRLQGPPTGNHVPSLLPITQDILVSLGVRSQEELVEALKDRNLEELFSHTSVPTYEMFVFAQAKIERARENILSFLSELDEYDCNHAEFIATSVIGGISKNGQEIHVVTRPSDSGEVIFYYGSEKDTLEEPGAELWIENGKTNPRMLTLGRILKVNHINKVKVD